MPVPPTVRSRAAAPPAAVEQLQVSRPADRTMKRLVVPEHVNRNTRRVHAIGPEKTGAALLRVACDLRGLADLSGCDVLDVGCGVRFAQTILNCDVPIRSYAGVDVDELLIRFLQSEVDDPRFTFAYWDVHNPLYNPRGPRMTRESMLPVAGEFDVSWLFSVFTHLPPDDAEVLCLFLRRHACRGGRRLFLAFLDPTVATFVEKSSENPGLHSTYHEGFLRSLVERNGWRVLAVHDKDPATKFIQHHFVCGTA
ncbi:MAG: class I SAM-dependent methyltransferase [Planctomycetes bacterium]|nr:class I SAM-dependent methyltransferase [Planctomycetota bacterium]